MDEKPDATLNGGSPDVSGPLLAKPTAPNMDTSLEMTIVVEKEDNGDFKENPHRLIPEKSEGPAPQPTYIERLEKLIGTCLAKHKRWMLKMIKGTLLLVYMVYFIYCMKYRFGDEGSFMLIGGTAILLLVVFFRVSPGCFGCCDRMTSLLTFSPRWRRRIRYGLYLAAIAGLATHLGLRVFIYNPQNAQSLFGIFGIVLFCLLLSQKPSKINWHPVFWGFVIQFVFATFTLQTEFGYNAFMWLGAAVQHLLEFSHAGSAFVIGKDFQSLGLAFGYAGAMIFFGSMMGLLIHFGVIGFLVLRGGRALSAAMETGPVESVIAVANIFIGMSSAPLLVLPYLPTLSVSELGALMTCGYASVSGDVMALFIASGAPANHLLTAAIISAPAALAVAKILMPETEEVDLEAQADVSAAGIGGSVSQNALSAASDGALVTVRLVVSAMVNMLAFVSLLSLIDAILEFFGERAGVHGLTFATICGYALFPISFAMGVPYEDCSRVGSLIGIKLFATPVVGYAELGKIINNRMILEEYVRGGNQTWNWEGTDIILHSTNTTLIHGILSEKAEVIATYAMCGFSAFTAIGISIGALTSLCPSRKMDVIKLVPLSFLGGNVASFATGAVAGLLHTTH